MTMTQRERLPLARHLVAMREHMPHPWDLAGTEAALVKLNLENPNPWDVDEIAIAWARRPDARTPEGMTHPNLRTQPTPTPATPRRTQPIQPCPTHGYEATRGPGGPHPCCLDEPHTCCDRCRPMLPNTISDRTESS